MIKLLVEELSDKYSPKLQEVIQDYILAQAKVQCIRSRSGNLDDGFGLGEPKFTVHLDPFQGDWGTMS